MIHLSRGLPSILVFISLPATLPSARAQDAASARDSYVERVQPIIVKNCSGCHTSGGHAGGLRLDSLASMLKGGGRGPAIVPGKPEASTLAKAIHYDGDDLRMPPRGKITDSEIAAIDKWIKDNNRNPFGDSKDAMYAGGTPLFDERSGKSRDKYEYILEKHPELRKS